MKKGDKVIVRGFKGIITNYHRANEYILTFCGNDLGTRLLTSDRAEELYDKGFNTISTGKSFLVFTADFPGLEDTNISLKVWKEEEIEGVWE